MVIEVQQDEYGELYLELTPELLDELGWSVGDTIVWSQDQTTTNTWVLSKKA